MARSFFFPVALQGLGTPDVESMSSYICRLSAAHRAPIGVLLRCGYEQHFSTSTTGEGVPNLARNPGSLAQYVRPNEMTSSVLEMLTATTGQKDLRSGTFMCLDKALDRCMKTFQQSNRWCPRCFRDFADRGTEAYLKLAWSVATTTHCALHGDELEDKCRKCGSDQDGFGVRRSCSICVHCGSSLAKGSNSSHAPGAWQVDGADLDCLMIQIASNPDLSFSAGGVTRALEQVLDKAWREDSATELWKLVPRDELLAITCGVTPVTLAKVRRLSFRLGVRVTDLLSGSIKQTSAVLDPSWTEVLPKPIRPKRRLPRHDLRRLRASLDEALRDCRGTTPSCLTQIARNLGVTGGCIRYHFPIHANGILRLYSAWRQRDTKQKREQAKQAVAKYLNAVAPPLSISAKGALRDLRKRTSLPKDVLRQEIALALDMRSVGIPSLNGEGAVCLEKRQ
jgi:hypothetical protein